MNFRFQALIFCSLGTLPRPFSPEYASYTYDHQDKRHHRANAVPHFRTNNQRLLRPIRSLQRSCQVLPDETTGNNTGTRQNHNPFRRQR